ncbi:MAG: two component transcriptional regulator, winged helix family [Acidobacteriaceae bacterium]|nr:two component transcriptional regulator, winged helix family [Acidobacteriaceae bacterium]
MHEKILIVEDDAVIRMALEDRLQSEGYKFDHALDGEEGLRKAKQDSFDLVILDIMLPRKNGFDVCRDMRMAGLVFPIIMLTARGQTIDKVLGLKIGADDYLTKPFDSMELLARIEALLRRAKAPAAGDAAHQFGSLKIDLRGTSVKRNGEIVPLSAREFQLLRYLVERRGETLSRDLLLKEVWDYSSEAFTRTVDVHVASLRQKIEENPKQPKLILTVPGLGYKFAA